MFGLSLGEKGKEWYTSLDDGEKTDYARLKDLFIKRFSEAGYSNNLMVRLMNVSQREKEDVRDYVTKVRGLFKRIPTAEQPTERVVSTVFINGIRNEELYKALASNSNL